MEETAQDIIDFQTDVEMRDDLNNIETSVEPQIPISVFVKTNEEGYVTDVNSEIFIKDFTGWQKIDEGYGDKFAHAQSQYFDNPLLSDDGNFNIRLEK